MAEQAQAGRWRFESEHASLIVYHEGQRIAQFSGGVFETADGEIAAALRGFGAYCREVAAPILAPSTEAAGSKPAKAKPADGR